MNGLAQRALTAVFFVIVVVGSIYWNLYSFGILFLVVTILCLWEFFTLSFTVFPINNMRRLLGVAIGVLPFLIAFLEYTGFINANSTVFWSSFLGGSMLLFIYELFAADSKPFQNIGIFLAGIVYVGIPMSLLWQIAFYVGSYSPHLIFGMLWLTWTNDTAAYLIGSWIGRHKLFPRISPKKTWEGSIAGVLCTMLMAYGMSFVFTEFPASTWIAIGAVVAIFGSLGDLVESMLKRSMGVKDSGTLLPGHGGFLDRFDAFIFLIPFVWLVLLWV